MAAVHAARLMLQLLGFFEELGSSTFYSGSMRELMRDAPGRDEASVVKYLREGYVVLDVLDTPVDVISGGRRIVGASSLVTDGAWLWRVDLADYVDRYHVRLPDEFIDHARKLGYSVPELSDEYLAGVCDDAVRYF